MIATNSHKANFDPLLGEDVHFVNTRSHWKFVSFLKLKILFRFLQDWVEALGEQFSTAVFVFGLRYRAIKIKARALISFLLGMAKLVIWITKKYIYLDRVGLMW